MLIINILSFIGLSLPSQSQNLIEPDPELQRMRRLRRTVPRAVTYKVR